MIRCIVTLAIVLSYSGVVGSVGRMGRCSASRATYICPLPSIVNKKRLKLELSSSLDTANLDVVGMTRRR